MDATRNVKLVADVAMFAGGEVLMVRYLETNKYDHQPGWFLPDDLVADREHPEDAARRILDEQLGLAIERLALDHIESFTGNDRSWHLVFHFRADLVAKPDLQPAGDIRDAAWFDLNRLPARDEIAHHGWALGVLARMQVPVV